MEEYSEIYRIIEKNIEELVIKFNKKNNEDLLEK